MKKACLVLATSCVLSLAWPNAHAEDNSSSELVGTSSNQPTEDRGEPTTEAPAEPLASAPEPAPAAREDQQSPPAPRPFADVCQFRQRLYIATHPHCHRAGRKLYTEYPKYTDAQLKDMANQVVDLFAAASKRHSPIITPKKFDPKDPNYDGGLRRTTHSKSHGCAQGEFKIAENIPKDLQVEPFTESNRRNGKPFPVWARWANGNSGVKPDSAGDARAMSFKLFGIDGPKLVPGGENSKAMDFQMNDDPAFLIKDPADFLKFFQVVMTGKSAPAVELGLAEFLGAGRFDEAEVISRMVRNKIANPLQRDYYSGTAYAWGAKAVKYSTRQVPCPGFESYAQYQIPKNPADDYLSAAVQKQLGQDKVPACFDFGVQVQADPWKEPIEDPTIAWKSKFVPIGHLRFNPQDVADPGQKKFCENLTISNWRVTKEFRPLGELNKMRRYADPGGSARRHAENHAPNPEPTGFEKFGAAFSP